MLCYFVCPQHFCLDVSVVWRMKQQNAYLEHIPMLGVVHADHAQKVPSAPTVGCQPTLSVRTARILMRKT